jgi:hypothetical protein
MPVGYQNQSTVWYIGGDNVTFDGHGTGTFDGNGQVWYDFVNGMSNYRSTSKSSIAAPAKKPGREANGVDDLEHAEFSFPGPKVYTKPDVVSFSCTRHHRELS